MFGFDDRKKAHAVMYAVVGIVLLMASFVLPWWGSYWEMEERSADDDRIFDHHEDGFGVSLTSGFSFDGSGTSLYNRGQFTSMVYAISAMLLIVALIFSSLMITGLMLDIIHRNLKSRLPMMFGIFAVFFCLLTPIAFAIALPIAMEADARKEAEEDGDEYEAPDHNHRTKSFFGSHNEEDIGSWSVITTTRRWGGDIGWFLALLASAFLIISIILIKPGKTIPPPTGFPPMEDSQNEAQPPHLIRQSPPSPPQP
jgi:hypothetical protein